MRSWLTIEPGSNGALERRRTDKDEHRLPAATRAASDSRGSDSRGSDSRGSDSRGSDSRGSDSRGSGVCAAACPSGSSSSGATDRSSAPGVCGPRTSSSDGVQPVRHDVGARLDRGAAG